ncbi:hypothetical protein H4Q26_010131 [Puccinia striiformis f. sp. tritici PST-130]|nr:hypothetical protein H4Q26_010131 [Puccinia striiformis f. sp. tritici PST-130]
MTSQPSRSNRRQSWFRHSTQEKKLKKRTPPPNPDAYIDYKFGLSWSGGKGTCSLSCDEAFHLASNSPCTRPYGGTQNIMATSGTVDAGCGQYSGQSSSLVNNQYQHDLKSATLSGPAHTLDYQTPLQSFLGLSMFF